MLVHLLPKVCNHLRQYFFYLLSSEPVSYQAYLTNLKIFSSSPHDICSLLFYPVLWSAIGVLTIPNYMFKLDGFVIDSIISRVFLICFKIISLEIFSTQNTFLSHFGSFYFLGLYYLKRPTLYSVKQYR